MKAVLFDLDDTLFDHLHCARTGLVRLSKRYPAMQGVTVRELEERYSAALESIHLRLLRGEVTQTEARTRRMQQLFGSFEIHVNEDQAIEEYHLFRRNYDAAAQVVRGSYALLDRLSQAGIRLAVVTNNLVAEQIPKLQQLKLDHYFDVVTISEAVGVSKPDPYIFEVTLSNLSLSASDVVMVGDSLTSDIAGAQAAGIPCVWLKRRKDNSHLPPKGVPLIEEDLRDTEQILRLLAEQRVK